MIHDTLQAVGRSAGVEGKEQHTIISIRIWGLAFADLHSKGAGETALYGYTQASDPEFTSSARADFLRNMHTC